MKTTRRPLEGLFLDALADIYYAECELVSALPRMAKAAINDDLRNAFRAHLEEASGHVRKVEKVFGAFGAKVKGKKCPAIIGLLEEGEEMAADNKGRPTLNAALIAAAQKVEHYKIATYGSLLEWAQLLGNCAAVSLLEEILEEEKTADRNLTWIARLQANRAAKVSNRIVSSSGRIGRSLLLRPDKIRGSDRNAVAA